MWTPALAVLKNVLFQGFQLSETQRPKSGYEIILKAEPKREDLQTPAVGIRRVVSIPALLLCCLAVPAGLYVCTGCRYALIHFVLVPKSLYCSWGVRKVFPPVPRVLGNYPKRALWEQNRTICLMYAPLRGVLSCRRVCSKVYWVQK